MNFLFVLEVTWQKYSICRKESPKIFTALHAMQTRSSDEKAVYPSARLSVRLSNAWIVTKRKKDLSRFLYHTKYHVA